MRRILSSMLLAASFVGVVKAQTTGPTAEKVKKEILALENEKVQATLKGSDADTDYYERYDVDDVVYAYPDGSLSNKADHIKALRNSKRTWTQKPLALPGAHTEIEDMVVRIYDKGNVAVVTFVNSREVPNTEINGKAAPRQAIRAATVYVKENGKWRRVLHTAASIPIKETSNR